jgi:hypothetical protein
MTVPGTGCGRVFVRESATIMPFRTLLVGVGKRQYLRLIESLPDDPQTDGQAGLREPAAQRKAGQSGFGPRAGRERADADADLAGWPIRDDSIGNRVLFGS